MTTIFGLTRSNKQVTATGEIESKTPGGLYINTVVPCAPHVDPVRLNPLIPAPGVVTNGFQCCDGAARKPEFNIPGNLPKLDDDRLVGGDSLAGAMGGSKNAALNTDNLPNHSHNLGVTSGDAPHSHPGSLGNSDAYHYHSTGYSGYANLPHSHEQNVNVSNWSHNNLSKADWKTDAVAGQFTQGISVSPSSGPHTHPSSNVAAANAPHSHPGSSSTQTDSHTHNLAATADFGGSDTLNIEPEAMTVIYIVRIA